MNKILKESMDTIQHETLRSIFKKSTEDPDIESLDKKKNELLQKAKKTPKTKEEHA